MDKPDRPPMDEAEKQRLFAAYHAAFKRRLLEFQAAGGHLDGDAMEEIAKAATQEIFPGARLVSSTRTELPEDEEAFLLPTEYDPDRDRDDEEEDL